MHDNKYAYPTSDEDILKAATERFALAEEAESEIRRDAEDDLRFSVGEQWPEEIKAQRAREGRPCLTINRIPQFIRQITNDQRQNRPSIKVSPVDDFADVESAKINQGLIRHIEYSSNADVAYDTAFDSASRCGFGFWRVVTEYSDPYSFDQDIRIKAVKDRFSAYLDPSHQEPDGSDANWGFVFEDVPKDQFCATYGESKLSKESSWKDVDSKPGWVTELTCRVAEYFYKEFKDTEIVLVGFIGQDGLPKKQVIEKSKLKEGHPLDIQILAERKTIVPVVKWVKTNGVEILEKTDWLGRWIPIIPVYGEELVIKGKRILSGVVRNAKDSMRMYNYWASAETETIALAPRAPYIGAAGQFEGFENKWETANSENHAYLEYNPITIGGQPSGPPQRNFAEPPVQAISQARMLASEDLKATTGIYDAALGNRSNEQSGIAIQRRSLQAQISNFHLIDNLSRSIRHTGRIILDLIPQIYDTERVVRILGEDGTEEVIKVNQQFDHNGKLVTYDLSVGKYDVTVDTGPSFETKRQEAVQAMLEFTKAMPQQAAMMADLLVKNMDWPGAQEISERMRKLLPPEITGEDQKGEEIPPQAQAQLQQQQMLIDQLTQQLNAVQDEKDKKLIEIESKERIEMQKLQVQLQIELAKLDAQDSQLLLKTEVENYRAQMQAQIAELEDRLTILGQNEPIQYENQEQDFNPDSVGQPEPEAPLGMDQPMPSGDVPLGNYVE